MKISSGRLPPVTSNKLAYIIAQCWNVCKLSVTVENVPGDHAVLEWNLTPRELSLQHASEAALIMLERSFPTLLKMVI